MDRQPWYLRLLRGHFDFDNYSEAEILKRWPKAGVQVARALRAYKWIGRRVTGNSMHALNGQLVYLFVVVPRWLLTGSLNWDGVQWWWIFVTIFYTQREIPALLRGTKDPWDNITDFVWVYAFSMLYWFPVDWVWGMYVTQAWLLICVACQIKYYTLPAPEWMPRKPARFAVLWEPKTRRPLDS